MNFVPPTVHSEGKDLSTEEQVKNVLRVLPNSKWDVKVAAIRKANDLTRMFLDELVSNLKTYEMNMKDINRASESDELDDEDVNETTLMAIGDSDMEEEYGASELSISEIKEKLHLF
ncbi:putative MLO-like protein 3-like [Capsicum annuum]|nr:putative MLO-like protein 3-like [Capsicum annuum]